MKTSTLFSSALFATLSLLSSSSAHIAISNPPAQAGPWTKDLSKNVHAWIGYQGKKFPCGGYKKGPVTTYQAGEQIDVMFWTFGIDDYKKLPPPGVGQSRHGGGACEFSLSYDGGKTWWVIGQYTKTCPDIYYKWPVVIPNNVPACKDSDKCLFSMSWTAYSTDQWYHHCANIVIENKNQASLGKNVGMPPLAMTIVDVTQNHQKMNTHAVGDTKSTKSSGPSAAELAINQNGKHYAFDSTKKGAKPFSLNLNLIAS
ncbi:hypothetical protein BGZ98_009821 [Dissophora globulifera]|nr:hypothetical protein BGZ98_009821 [Dissophora globulifera]